MAKLQLILLGVLCTLSSVSSDFSGGLKQEGGLGPTTHPNDDGVEELRSAEFVEKPKRPQNSSVIDMQHGDTHDHSAELLGSFNSSTGPGRMAGKASKLARIENEHVVIEGTDLGNVTLVHLCCAHNEIFNSESMQCLESDADVHLIFHDKTGNLMQGIRYSPVVGVPNCSVYNLSPTMNGRDDHFTVSTQGELIVGDPSKGLDSPPFVVPVGEYCLLFPEPDIMEALVCFPDEQVQTVSTTYRRDFQLSVYPTCLLVGSVFLVLTLLVYCIVPELREEAVARSFMCSIAMLALGQVLMVTGQWGISSLIHTPACIALGSLTHFSFLSAFLWLNVISIMVLRSLWRSGSSNPSPRPLSPMCYRALYGFGVAALVAVLALLRDLLPVLQGTALPPPRFGAISCWFSRSDALVAYLLGPISVLLLANLLCFCVAAYKMFTLNKHSDRSKLHFSQYMKLFVLMGVSWIFEVISFFVNAATEDSSWLTYLWVFFDMVNILQGVLIFVLFVCRKSVLRHLASKLCGSTGCLGDNERDDAELCNTVV